MQTIHTARAHAKKRQMRSHGTHAMRTAAGRTHMPQYTTNTLHLTYTLHLHLRSHLHLNIFCICRRSRRSSPSHETERSLAQATTGLTAPTISPRGGGAPTRACVLRGSSATRTPHGASVGSSRVPPSKWPCAAKCGPTAPSSGCGRRAVAWAVQSSCCLPTSSRKHGYDFST